MEERGLDVPTDLLDLDPEELRALGHWVVDQTVEHLRTLRERPVISTGEPSALAAALGGPLPRAGATVTEGLGLLTDVALVHQQHAEHPRYFARVAGPSSDVALLGDWLATGMQAMASSWAGGSGPSTLELVALDWLREALGLAPAAEGVLTSGGSLANTTALLVARNERGAGAVYVSDQTHSSILRSLRTTGVLDVRVLPTDDRFCLSTQELQRALHADLAGGIRPLAVVATLGTTNTGAADDLVAIADLCAAHGMWLHVDGAYGGPTALVAAVPGLERADSFVLDPHKWLFAPYDIGCVWVAHPGALEQAFAMHPEYLADVRIAERNLHNRGLELTRRARGVKLWLTLRTYGIDRITAAISRGIALAEVAEAAVRDIDGLELVTPAQRGVVTFAGAGAADADHLRVAAELTADGYAAVSSTVLHGRTVLRLCTINPRTTEAEVIETVHRLAALLAPTPTG